jgi:hypothetical protein
MALFFDDFHEKILGHLIERTKTILDIKASNTILEENIEAVMQELDSIR